MKHIYLIPTFLIFALSLFSCSSDDDSTEEEIISEFAMTAKINGETFEANTPFGDNMFTDFNIFSIYPIEDFVLLQARMGGIVGNQEINLWLKRSDIVVGSYNVSYDDLGLTPPTHYIRYYNNNNSISEFTLAGVVNITEVDSATSIVKGTFEFTTVDDEETAPVDFTITNGTFNYIYK